MSLYQRVIPKLSEGRLIFMSASGPSVEFRRSQAIWVDVRIVVVTTGWVRKPLHSSMSSRNMLNILKQTEN